MVQANMWTIARDVTTTIVMTSSTEMMSTWKVVMESDVIKLKT
jgi:hypothetical protein